MDEASLDFFAYRLTVHEEPQRPLLGSRRPKPELLHSALLGLPEVRLRRRSEWQVGNLREVDESAIEFHLGRQTTTSLPQLDDGRFVDRSLPTAPHTLVVVDWRLGLCLIGRQPRLSPQTASIAYALEAALAKTAVARDELISFEVSPLRQPKMFLERLRSAAVVRRLWVLTKRPNPFDSEEDFVAPTAKVLEELQGDQVKTEWAGVALDVQRREVAEIIGSTASRGGDAGATIKEEPDKRATRIRMTFDLVSIGAEGPIVGIAKEVISKVRVMYRGLRHPDDGLARPK